MAIIKKISASKLTAPTKEKIIEKLSNNSIWANSKARFYRTGNILFNHETRTYRFYSLEKHNTKIKTTKRIITRGKRKGEVEVTREFLRKAHWVAYYYDIPADWVASAKQHTRHFELKLK